MTTTFYIFHGDDELSINENVKKFRNEMGGDINAEMNITTFDGTSASAAEVVNAVSSFPFLSDKRLVIVKGMIGWYTRKGAGKKGKEEITKLEERLPGLPDYARLVFVEHKVLTDKNSLIKLAKSTGYGVVRQFTVPKDTTHWVIQRAKNEYDIKIEPQAAAALSSVTGNDLRRVDNELIKLVSYVDEGADITEQDVAALTPYVAEASIWDIVDSIAEGNGRKALTLLHRLLAEKDEDPFKSFGMIIRQFRLMLLAKEHLVTGGASDANSVAKALGLRSNYPAHKAARQSRPFSLEDLERIYRQLSKIDIDMKTGRIKPELALDLFITSIAKP